MSESGQQAAPVKTKAVLVDSASMRVVWMNEAPLLPGRSYFLKIGTSRLIGSRENVERLVGQFYLPLILLGFATGIFHVEQQILQIDLQIVEHRCLFFARRTLL